MYPLLRRSFAKVTRLMHDCSGGSLSAIQLSGVIIELDTENTENTEFTGASTDFI